MTPPPPSDVKHPTRKLAIGWCLAVVAMYGGVVWFSSENLQNNADIRRLDIWLAIPELLGEYIAPAVDPNQPMPAPSGWWYFTERLDPRGGTGWQLWAYRCANGTGGTHKEDSPRGNFIVQ